MTLGFALAMVRAVLMGGPTDLGKAAVVAVPYFLFGLLVVRKGLLSVTVLPILISPFFDNQTSHELHLDNPQVVFWIVGFAVWASAVSMGFWIRRWIDR